MLVVNDARTERNPAHCDMNSATQHLTRWRRRTSNREMSNTTTTVAPTPVPTMAPTARGQYNPFANATYGWHDTVPLNFARAVYVSAPENKIEFDGGTIFAIIIAIIFSSGFVGILLLFQRNYKTMEIRRKRHAELVAAAVNDSLRSPTYGQLDSSQSAPTSPENSPMYSASNSYDHGGANSRDRAHTDRGLGSPRVHHEYAAPRDYPASSISLYRQGSYVPADPAKVRDILEDADL
jgi:hypothetical protein